MMTYREALTRALVTFVWAATGAMAGAALLDFEAWKGAAAAGIGAVLNFAHRASQAYLERRDNGA